MTAPDQFPPASARQQRFLHVVLSVLVDVTVLSIFVEHWDRIVIDSYTIALLTAILLQAMLTATMAVEHRIVDAFRGRSGTGWMTLRVLSTWAVLFGSKIVILEAVDLVFGDHVELGGLIPFVTLVVAMLVAEAIIERIYDALA